MKYLSVISADDKNLFFIKKNAMLFFRVVVLDLPDDLIKIRIRILIQYPDRK